MNLFKKKAPDTTNAELPYKIPTVEFDATRVNAVVQADLRENIRSFTDIDPKDFQTVYDAALRSISGGRNLHILAVALEGIGIGRGRAGDIARTLNNRATGLMNIQKQMELGIEYATWIYSAPCVLNPNKRSEADVARDAAHMDANGKPFLVAKGMLMNGRWVRPGWDEGCKCIQKAMVRGFDGYAGGKPPGM